MIMVIMVKNVIDAGDHDSHDDDNEKSGCSPMIMSWNNDYIIMMLMTMSMTMKPLSRQQWAYSWAPPGSSPLSVNRSCLLDCLPVIIIIMIGMIAMISIITINTVIIIITINTVIIHITCWRRVWSSWWLLWSSVNSLCRWLYTWWWESLSGSCLLGWYSSLMISSPLDSAWRLPQEPREPKR